MDRVLDYSQCVAVYEKEEMGCLSSFAAGLDRKAEELGAPLLQGRFRFFPSDLGRQIADFERQRMEIFGFIEHQTCPYCNSNLKTVYDVRRGKHKQSDGWCGRIFVRSCAHCGWWESSDECSLEMGEDNWYRALTLRRRALLREFSVGGSEVPINTLRKHILKHPNSLARLNPTKLEKLVQSVWADHMDCEAVHLGGPNDEGIDLVLVDGETKYAVQVKRRSTDSAEPVSGIREFVGAMLLQDFVKGIFVSTAPRFSLKAQALADRAKDRKLVEYIDLVDSERLIDICRLTRNSSEPSWKSAATSPDEDPELPDDSFYGFPIG